jgi:hypothetical protein
MQNENQKNADRDAKNVYDRDDKEQDSNHVHDAECRCKEAGKMTFFQLLKQMMNDFSFWKNKGR